MRVVADVDEYVGLDKEAYPEPRLGDLLEMRRRIDRTRAVWVQLVEAVRELRYHQDITPDKWQVRLNLPDNRRFRTNATDNEIIRVSALLSRNRPKPNVPAAGESNPAKERAAAQTQWGAELLETFERQSLFPIFDRVDDAACETGIGVIEEYLTPSWDAYEELRDEYASTKGIKEKRDLEAQMRSLGLPMAIRPVDPLAVYYEPDDQNRVFRALIVERKDYRQVFAGLRETLTLDQFNKAQIPPIAALGTPIPATWGVRVSINGDPDLVNFAPDAQGQVEVMRYYDRRWLVEVVAGHIVRCDEHGLPGVPVFLQFGKVTSSSYLGYMLRGVTFGTIEQELATNDWMTGWEDNQMTYGRPFPSVTTSEQGQMRLDVKGQPDVINLSDPTKPPQLGPGQKIEDAFGGFRGNFDPAFLGTVQSFTKMSGLNPISSGESPGADPSGYAINTLNANSMSPYITHLKNKQRMLGQLIDFNRLLVRDCIGGPVPLAVKNAEGSTVDYVTLTPDLVDEVPTEVAIDPLSDAQRMAMSEWALTGNEKGFLSHSTTQRIAYGNIVQDQAAEDDNVLLDQGKEALKPIIVESVVRMVQQDAFPETLPPDLPATPGGTGDPTGGAPAEPPAPTIGAPMSAASQVSPTGPSPAQGLANRGRGGQMPISQPTQAPI